MIQLHHGGVTLHGGVPTPAEAAVPAAREKTMAYQILRRHDTPAGDGLLHLTFDSLISHDITYVGVIQTAKASGMTEFPVPYVLTNCHNSLCAVGGTINEDDHVFGLSAAIKYGGDYVPANQAVIHQYAREMMSGCGRMILGSDSHTRYGALGTMGVGEGGPEIVKQLLKNTYDIAAPEVILVWLTGQPPCGVGPHDVAIALCGAVYKNGFVKNKVLEFAGPAVSRLPMDYRIGIDVMTTETTCLTSVWCTDDDTKAYLAKHGRADDYRELKPADVTYYDGLVYVDLSTVKPMIALPFHPSNAFEIDELNANLGDILREVEKEAARLTEGKDIEFSLTDKITPKGLQVQQGIIAGCAGGTYTNVMAAAHILKGAQCGQGEFTLDVYPSSQPVFMDLLAKGAISDLMATGAIVKTAFCGPCFGAGDTPANNALSIRHATRNFPNREGSKPGAGQLSAVALMDARSIAATAANGGILTSAEKYADNYEVPEYNYDDSSYRARIYNGFGKAEPEDKLIYGPNIKDWPEQEALAQNILLRVCSKIMDKVTTTDELIPSGETSSYRSNPLGLAEFTLSRRDPGYVQRAKDVRALEKARLAGEAQSDEALKNALGKVKNILPEVDEKTIEIGSVIYCVKPGDGSAREQAASCQRVLGGLANICSEYATKRYRSNVMNWGMLPFQMEGEPNFEVGDYVFVPGIRATLDGELTDIAAWAVRADGSVDQVKLAIADMTPEERAIVKAGCLINYNRAKAGL